MLQLELTAAALGRLLILSVPRPLRRLEAWLSRSREGEGAGGVPLHKKSSTPYLIKAQGRNCNSNKGREAEKTLNACHSINSSTAQCAVRVWSLADCTLSFW